MISPEVDAAYERFMRGPIPASHAAALGEALRQGGRPLEAISVLERAVGLEPGRPETQRSLALALRQVGRVEDALASLEQAAQRIPDDFGIQYLLANVLHQTGAAAKAVTHFSRALALDPKSVEAHVDLGVTFRALGRPDEAVEHLQRATVLGPKVAIAHNNLGVTLLELGRLDEAVASFRRALSIEPNLGMALVNLGNACKASGHVGDAIDAYRRARDLDPTNHVVHSNLVYTLPFHPDYDAAAILAEASLWRDRHAAPLAYRKQPHANAPSADRRLRIGYVSAGFCAHVQSFFLLPLFRHHDRSQFEIVAYANVARPDETTALLRTHVDHWREIAWSDDVAVADLVRADGIDVLVDLDMHMANNRMRVFAQKPAPVQICWLAYPGTTGLDAIDHRVTDPFLDPPAPELAPYAEASVALPDTFWCYDPLTSEPEPGPLPALWSGAITFGSLNNLCKVNEAVIALWSQILCAVRDARLVLHAPAGRARHRVRDAFARNGVDPKRIAFTPFLPRADYLAAYRTIDVALDPFPANGHTTSLDALWMGVPVVTLAGTTVLGRAGVSQAMNLRLPELIADTAADYVRIATDLARDLPRLRTMRAELRGRMSTSPLMDGPRFAKNMERVYRDAFRRWCENPERAAQQADPRPPLLSRPRLNSNA